MDLLISLMLQQSTFTLEHCLSQAIQTEPGKNALKKAKRRKSEQQPPMIVAPQTPIAKSEEIVVTRSCDSDLLKENVEKQSQVTTDSAIAESVVNTPKQKSKASTSPPSKKKSKVPAKKALPLNKPVASSPVFQKSPIEKEEAELLKEISSAKNRKPRNFKQIVKQYGWELERVAGDHYIYKNSMYPGSLSIPNHEVIKEGTARAIIKHMMSAIPKDTPIAFK